MSSTIDIFCDDIVAGHWTQLQSLNLTRTLLGNKGVTSLSSALAASHLKQTNLTALNLSENHITDIGALPFSVVITLNTSLQELHLKNNFISEMGIQALNMYWIFNNTTRKESDLKLEGNKGVNDPRQHYEIGNEQFS